jgi:hypothetical protein
MHFLYGDSSLHTVRRTGRYLNYGETNWPPFWGANQIIGCTDRVTPLRLAMAPLGGRPRFTVTQKVFCTGLISPGLLTLQICSLLKKLVLKAYCGGLSV